MDRKRYQEDLRRRQREHLEKVRNNHPFKPCRHDGCSECCGTGIKEDGTTCVHMISCDCPKCQPYSMRVDADDRQINDEPFIFPGIPNRKHYGDGVGWFADAKFNPINGPRVWLQC